MKAFFLQFGKALAFLAVLAFLGFGESAEAYTHHEESCAVHSHGDGAEHSDCENTESGHEHKGSDACKLGHCHSSHCSTFSQQKIALQRLVPAQIFSQSSANSAYLNPYLGLPLQPPRA
jgi:hypothetical protein